jgi:hypothetical protein
VPVACPNPKINSVKNVEKLKYLKKKLLTQNSVHDAITQQIVSGRFLIPLGPQYFVFSSVVPADNCHWMENKLQ